MESSQMDYKKYITRIQMDIFNIFKNYRGVVFHKAKLACICTNLKQFNDKLGKQTWPQTHPSPNESSCLHHLISQLGKLSKLFTEFDAANAFNTLLRNPLNYINDQIHTISESINQLAKQLNLPIVPLPIDPNQEMTDDQSDLENIQKMVMAYVQQNGAMFPPETRQTLDKKLEAIAAKLAEYSETTVDDTSTDTNNRKLTDQEITDELRKLSEYSVDINDFEFQKKVGHGGFSEVYLGVQKSTSLLVAIKKLTLNSFDRQSLAMFQREVTIMGTVKHFAVLPFIGVSFNSPYYIITKYMSGDSLFNRLRSQSTSLNPTKRTIIALGVAYALAFLHTKNIIHRDLKSLNVLLDENDYPTLCDFGMSRETATEMTSGAGTIQWMAPEIINSAPYTTQADVYSYAILLWELLTSNVPYKGMGQTQIALAVVSKGMRPGIPEDCPPRLAKFIKQCWDQDPEQRPTMATIANLISRGEIVFPGTQLDILQSYVERCSDTPASPLAPQAVGTSDVPKLLDALHSPNPLSALVEVTQQLSQSPGFSETISSEPFIEAFSHILQKCRNSNVAGRLFDILAALSADHLNKLSAEIVQLALDLFSKYATTEMVSALVLFSRAIPSYKPTSEEEQGPVIVAEIHVAKLKSFLLGSNVSQRVQSTKLLAVVATARAYSQDTVLRSTIRPLLENLNVENMDELVAASLECLTSYPSSMTPLMLEFDGLTALLHVLSSQRTPDITKLAHALIDRLAAGRVISEANIERFLRSLGDASPRLDGTSLCHFLKVFAAVLSSSTGVQALTRIENYSQRLMQFMSKDPRAAIVVLKIVYLLLQKPQTAHLFDSCGEELAEKLLGMLSEGPTTSSLAVCCLLVLPENLQRRAFYTQAVQDYLVASLSRKSKSKVKEFALRLAGVLSQTEEGAHFLENGLIEYVYVLMVKPSEEGEPNDNAVKKLACMVLDSFAQTLPFSQFNEKFLQSAINALAYDEYESYPAIFISAVVANTQLAKICADQALKPLIAQVLGACNEDKIDKAKCSAALVALQRIAECPEALEQIRSQDAISCFYRHAGLFVKTDMEESYLKIVDMISGTPAGMMAIRVAKEFPDLIERMLAATPQSSPQKQPLLRLHGRCLAALKT